MKRKIIVLHEYGDRRHFLGLEYLLQQKYPEVELLYREFSVKAHLKKLIKKRNVAVLLKLFSNIFSLLRLLFSGNQLVILGIAPYDIRLLDLAFILRKHQVFYFSSWSNWQGSEFPKRAFRRFAPLQNIWKRFLEQDISGLFTVTEQALESLRKRYTITCQSQVVYHGYDAHIFHCNEKEIDSDKNKDKLICVFVGRLVIEKGIEDILTIAARLPKEHFEFWLIGDGELKKHILKASKQQENIRYSGFIGDPRQLAHIYRHSDILLLPTREEAFGIVIIEAMACGTVVIAADQPGPREILQHKKWGFLINENTFVDKACHILRNLFTERQVLRKRKQESMERSREFTAESLSTRWENILTPYLSQRST